jgi:benzylsuccinate CoA-transferase BbsF subunit
MAGFQHLVGEVGELPIGPFGPYTDYVGPRFGLVALLAALDHRRRTGEGGWLDVSQAEAGIQFLAPQIADVAVTGTVAAACGNRDPQMAPHGVFRCGVEGGLDEWISIAVRDDAEWHALADLIGQPELAHDRRFACLGKRKENEAALEQIVSAWAAGSRAHVAEQQLQERGIPAAVAASSADMLADPQLAARGHFVRLDHPLMGTSTVESSRYQLSDTRPGPDRCAPLPGRDNTYVLRDILGYSENEIAALERSGVLS